MSLLPGSLKPGADTTLAEIVRQGEPSPRLGNHKRDYLAAYLAAAMVSIWTLFASAFSLAVTVTLSP